jgi:hypothetical protein
MATHSIWQTLNKLEVLIVVEIEQQFFCQTLCPDNFLLGEINPWSTFL